MNNLSEIKYIKLTIFFMIENSEYVSNNLITKYDCFMFHFILFLKYTVKKL